MIYKIYCKKNIEKFIDNDEYWDNYRLGDIFQYWFDRNIQNVLKI